MLIGKEHFPAEWPKDVQLMFQTELVNGVLATVQAFDGSANVLCLILRPERGGGNLTAMILDALHAHSKTSPSLGATKRSDESGIHTPASVTAAPDYHQPDLLPESQSELENITGPVNNIEPSAQNLQQKQNTSAASVSGKLTQNFREVLK